MTAPAAVAEHIARLGQLYRVTRQPDPDPAELRQRLLEAARHVPDAALHLDTPQAVEAFAIRLQGLVRTVQMLRAAMEVSDG